MVHFEACNFKCLKLAQNMSNNIKISIYQENNNFTNNYLNITL